MSQIVAEFDPIQPDEDETFTFDFVFSIAPNDFLISAIWKLSMASFSQVNDPTPSARLVGIPSVTANPQIVDTRVTQTSQRIGNTPVVGATYLVEATCGTSLGDTVSLWTYLRCLPPPPTP